MIFIILTLYIDSSFCLNKKWWFIKGLLRRFLDFIKEIWKIKPVVFCNCIYKLRRMSRLAIFGAYIPGFSVCSVLLVALVFCAVFLCYFGFLLCLLINIASDIPGLFTLVKFIKEGFVSFIKDRYVIWRKKNVNKLL